MTLLGHFIKILHNKQLFYEGFSLFTMYYYVFHSLLRNFFCFVWRSRHGFVLMASQLLHFIITVWHFYERLYTDFFLKFYY